jgi:hypothetical protein
MLTFFLLSDGADSAKQLSNTNNLLNMKICGKLLCLVFLGTQRKALLQKTQSKKSCATVPLRPLDNTTCSLSQSQETLPLSKEKL